MARVLVTGGAGFIGSHLVEALVSNGDDVVVLDDLSTGRRENLAKVAGRITFIEESVTKAEAVRQAVEGSQAVFHLAAVVSVQRCLEEPEFARMVNVEGAANVFDSARDHGASIVFASSSAVYGESDERPRSEADPCVPCSPYGEHKLAGEQLAKGGVPLRFFNVYGPRQNPKSEYAAVIPRFVDLAQSGRPLTIFGDGLQSRDFVHVRDVVRALRLASRSERHEPFNVGAGRSTTILQLAEVVQGAVGQRVPVEHRPAREGEIRHSAADVSKAAELLGFRAQVELEEGLATLLEPATA